MKPENEPEKDHCHGHRQRLRNRFNRIGPHSLQEYEIVELLLTYVLPRRDVKPIAKELLARFGSIRGIFEADEDSLTSVPYIKQKFTTLLKLIREINAIYHKQRAEAVPVTENIDEIVKYWMARIGDKKEEEFHVIYLDSNARIMKDESFPAQEFHFSGTIDKTVVYPRKIIEEGIRHKAYGIIVAHNHPNGSPEPSEYDKNLTRVLDIATQAVGMVLFDHVIVSPAGYFSFRKEKLL